MTTTYQQRQQALAIPGMKELLTELRNAKGAHADACLKVAPPTWPRTPARIRNDRQAAVLKLVVNEIEADIKQRGGDILLKHHASEMNLSAILATAVFVIWLGLVNATKQPLLLFTLPVGAVAAANLVKATDRLR
jgi:hypothetical protein